MTENTTVLETKNEEQTEATSTVEVATEIVNTTNSLDDASAINLGETVIEDAAVISKEVADSIVTEPATVITTNEDEEAKAAEAEMKARIAHLVEAVEEKEYDKIGTLVLSLRSKESIVMAADALVDLITDSNDTSDSEPSDAEDFEELVADVVSSDCATGYSQFEEELQTLLYGQDVSRNIARETLRSLAMVTAEELN